MKILSLVSGLALAAFGVTASAHAHLQRASPADGSVVTTSPSTLVLNFSEAARLTAAATDARQLLGQLARGERRRARDVRYVALHAGPRARARAAGTALTPQFGARPWDGRRRLATLPAKS